MSTLASLASGGGGGASVSSSATTGPQRSGDIGGSQFSFGGINTGTQSTLPPWAVPAAIGGAVLLGVVYLSTRRR